MTKCKKADCNRKLLLAHYNNPGCACAENMRYCNCSACFGEETRVLTNGDGHKTCYKCRYRWIHRDHKTRGAYVCVHCSKPEDLRHSTGNLGKNQKANEKHLNPLKRRSTGSAGMPNERRDGEVGNQKANEKYVNPLKRRADGNCVGNVDGNGVDNGDRNVAGDDGIDHGDGADEGNRVGNVDSTDGDRNVDGADGTRVGNGDGTGDGEGYGVRDVAGNHGDRAVGNRVDNVDNGDRNVAGDDGIDHGDGADEGNRVGNVDGTDGDRNVDGADEGNRAGSVDGTGDGEGYGVRDVAGNHGDRADGNRVDNVDNGDSNVS